MADDVVLRGVEQEFNDKLQEITDFIFTTSQENLVEAGKVDTGFLLKTGNVNRGFLRADIVYPAVYAEAVHYGRVDGFMPPVDPIQKWVTRKLGVKNQNEARSIAFAIAKSIEKRGIPAFPFLDRAVESAVQKFGVERR